MKNYKKYELAKEGDKWEVRRFLGYDKDWKEYRIVGEFNKRVDAEIFLKLKNTPPSQIEEDRLIKQARADQLKKLWNATQHDIVPEGTPPRDMSEELHKMIKELEE